MGSLDPDTLRHPNGGRELAPNFHKMLPFIPLLLDPEIAATAGVPDEVAEARAGILEAVSELQGVAENMLDTSGAAELVAPVNRGLLTLSDSGVETGETDAMVSAFVELVQQRLADPRRRLLCDTQTGDLVAAMVREGVIDSEHLGLRRAGQAAVGSGLVARLPAFPQAPMDELLDLRADLQDPLMRYRAAVISVSDDLPAALGSEGEQAVDEVWDSRVQPALLELRETLAQHGLVREVAKHAVTDIEKLLGGGSALFLGLTQVVSLSEFTAVATSAALAGVPPTSRGAWDAYQGARHARRHELFYLYALDDRVGAHR